jgi:Flp pilus assembly pilin Flp
VLHPTTWLRNRLSTATWFPHRERGQAMIEYALIMCLVVIVILVTLILLGNQVKNTYCNITSAVVSA